MTGWSPGAPLYATLRLGQEEMLSKTWKGHTLASVLSASSGGVATQLAIAPNFAAVASADISSLRLYLEQMAGELWSQERVSWTTHALQLASTGEFLAGKEILSRNLLGGEIVAYDSVISILQGAKPRTIPYRAGYAREAAQ